MSHTLWGGRFRKSSDKEFAKFNAMLAVDQRLLSSDIQSSLAFALALRRADILSSKELRKINGSLLKLKKRTDRDKTVLANAVLEGIEDVHTFVEVELYKDIGDLAFKLNTGRSRNDQVTTDLRMVLKDYVQEVNSLLCHLQEALIGCGKKYRDVIIPGYTHLQRAQPILWPHFLLAYYEMFKRDRQRMVDALKRIDVMPLGSGAIAGTNFSIQRKYLAKKLNFSQIQANSVDAVSDRDYVIELSSIFSIIAMHLSRLSEDLIIFSTTEFGFVQLCDSVTSGSSLMPQKKNPDSLELIRGKTGRVYGQHVTLLTVMKALPLTYNKDMAEDKCAIFDSFDTITACLKMMHKVIASINLDATAVKKSLCDSTLLATELADYLVRQGVAFRKAHALVGKIVLYAKENNKELWDFKIRDFKQIDSRFDKSVFEFLKMHSAINKKTEFGGTSQSQVDQALKNAATEHAQIQWH